MGNLTNMQWHLTRDIIDTIIVSWILSWIAYSIIGLIYLNHLSNKYLTPINRDEAIGNKKLKSSNDLINQYRNTDTLNILVLSGGGLRGLVPLSVLSQLEYKTGKKTGELFDFIAGSSTGAITAAGLCMGNAYGEYKFSAKEIFDEYETNSHKIFSSPWYHQWLTFFGFFAPRYLPDKKLQVLEYYSDNTTIGELKGNLLIPVYNLDKNTLEIVKNWSIPGEHSHDNYLTKDLVNGASSPPMIFQPMSFSYKGQKHLFIDPAVLLNNPLLHVFINVRSLFPDKKLNIVLLGNGSSASAKFDYRNMFSFGLYGFYQYLYSAPGLSSKLYVKFMEDFLSESQKSNEKVSFYRIVSDPVNNLSPTSVSKKNLQRIQIFAQKMLHENLNKINELAETLTKHKVSGNNNHE